MSSKIGKPTYTQRERHGLTTTTFRKWRHGPARGRRQDPGTSATNFRGRQRVKRLRLRKLQRQARSRQR